VLDFYEGYRAYVRGKVASFLAADEGTTREARERAEKDARRYYLLALSAGRESLLNPAVVAVGGVIGSGKSTLAEELSVAMSCPVVDSDRTRKALSGVSATDPLHTAVWSGAYTKENTDRVYAELRRRAECVLASGRPVILDASFREKDQRTAARALAEKHGLPFFFVEARAPEAVCRKRLKERARTRSVSDGRLEIFDDFVERWEPTTEIASAEHIVIDTTQPLEKITGELARRLPTWPAGLTQ
jgi:predicted kinase